jgi:thiol-disulfide isomerase/thioredoxin
MFICNHCPFVKHVNAEISKLAEKYQRKGIGFVAISSNDVENYPQDAPDLMKETAEKEGYPFPYLYDKTQEIAKAYHAACTPDFYLFDTDLKLVYRGQLDDSRPGNGIPVTGSDLRNAIDALLKGGKINPNQKPSIGCNIKWAIKRT